MEELRKTSVYDLINVWIDLTRPNTQHISESNSTKWHSSLGYNKCIENVEIVISEKLEITLLEVKIMLNSKKKVIDLTEAKLFKSRKRKATELKSILKSKLKSIQRESSKVSNEIVAGHGNNPAGNFPRAPCCVQTRQYDE